MRSLFCCILMLSLTIGSTAAAQEENSGFLSDYSILARSDEAGKILLFVRSDIEDQLAKYDSMIVDQPEIFIDPESKYKGMKPDTMVELAEVIRGAVIEGLSDSYTVTEEAGATTLYLRLAATNMYILKHKRGLFGYTPIGMVAGGIKSAASDFVDKNTLVAMRLEAEIQDSVSGEVIAAGIFGRGGREEHIGDFEGEPPDWDRLRFAFTGLGKRLGCRLNNANQPVHARVNCFDIPLEPPRKN